MVSSCFICGSMIFNRKSFPGKRKSFEGLKELLICACDLLSVSGQISPEDWGFLEGKGDAEEEENGQSLLCCGKCYDLLKSVAKVHGIILKRQKQLKEYLEQVERLIVNSEGRSDKLQSSLWNLTCFDFRTSVLKRIPCAEDDHIRNSSNDVCVKREVEACEDLNDEDDGTGFEDHFNDDHHWDNASPSQDHSVSKSEVPMKTSVSIVRISPKSGIGHEEDEKANIFGDGTGSLSRSQPQAFEDDAASVWPSKKRRIDLSCQELEHDSSSKPLSRRRTGTREAKKSAERALKEYTESYQRDDQDDNVSRGRCDKNDDKSEGMCNPVIVKKEKVNVGPWVTLQRISPESARTKVKVICDEDQDNHDAADSPPSPHSEPSGEEDEEIAVPKKRKRKKKKSQDAHSAAKKSNTSGQDDNVKVRKYDCSKKAFYPLDIASDNLYLYRWGTFVSRTSSHLHCHFHGCAFQTEWDWYPSFQIIKTHIEEEHRSKKSDISRKPYPCVMCNILLQNRHHLLQHLKQAHPHLFVGSQQRSICESCLMPCRKKNMGLHTFKHLNEAEKAEARATKSCPSRCLRPTEAERTEKPFHCDFDGCGMAFKSACNLKRHKRRHLPPELRTDLVLCPECGVTILKDGLAYHMQSIHHPETVKPTETLSCHYCGKRFLKRNRRALEDHLRRHRGENKFMCTECGAAYPALAQLTDHRKRKHPREEEKKGPYLCEWCDNQYERLLSLRAHVRRNHPEKASVGQDKRRISKFYASQAGEVKGPVFGPEQRFPCEICGTVCKYRFTLKTHLRNVHGIAGEEKGDWRGRKTMMENYRRKKGGGGGVGGEDEQQTGKDEVVGGDSLQGSSATFSQKASWT